MKIGILGFQGAVIEHQRHIEQLGQEAVVVRYTEQLAEIDGIILPGGEYYHGKITKQDRNDGTVP